MTTVIRATRPIDLLGLVPALLGFTPTESLVLIPFAANRSVGAMRFDLPDTTDQDQMASHADVVTGYVTRVPGVTSVVAVTYTAAAVKGAISMLKVLRDQLRRQDLFIAEMLYVSGEGWGSLMEGTGPNPLSEIMLDPDAPEPADGDQNSGAELPVVDEQLAAAIAEAVLHADETMPGLQLLRFMEAPVTEPLAPGDFGQLHWLLERPNFRDPLIVAWTSGLDTGIEAMVAQVDWEENGEDYPQDIAQIMWGEAPRPDSTRLRQALANVRTLLAVAPAPGCYAVAAWLSWALGQSSHAQVYAEAGLALDAEHGLCQIVYMFVDSGHLPAWAFERRAEA